LRDRQVFLFRSGVPLLVRLDRRIVAGCFATFVAGMALFVWSFSNPGVLISELTGLLWGASILIMLVYLFRERRTRVLATKTR
jgi:hypothetical protein